jgi:hypothetical protein
MISQIWRRRWARGLSRGRESSNRLAQNDWIWLVNGSLRNDQWMPSRIGIAGWSAGLDLVLSTI